MCEFDDSLTEIDWLNSLSIQKKSESKDGHILPVSISPPSVLVTPQNSPNDSFIVSRCKGYDKPSYSYAYLIKLAIESSENKKMKLNEIYSWIEETFPYYKFMQIDNNKGWKNAIRHNLSLNKIFKRCAKESSHLGKGSYWMIDSNSDEDVQYPPVKKMKVYHNFTDLVKSIHLKETIKSDVNINNKSNTTEETRNSSPFIWNGNVTLDQLVIPPSIILPQKLNFQSSDEPIILSDVKINNNNVSQDKCFSINSPILSYSNETLKHKCSTEPCPITECEISYKISPIYSNCPIISTESKTNLNLTKSSVKCLNEEKRLKDKLEVDEDLNNKSSKNDFILKTPVLSQINSFPEDNNGCNIESKYLGGYTMVKCSRSNNPFSILSQDCSDMFLENIELHDELIPHSFSDSESRSFELSQSTRKYLFNLSGVKETLLNRSHWLELDENEDSMSQSPYDVLNDTLRYDNLQIFDKRNNTDNSEISPSQDYIELKSSLMNYRYRSYTTRSNLLSVSTSSTEKSSNTLKSKSDPHRKSGSIDSAIDFNNQNPNHTENCDGDDEIKDIFPWDSLI